MILKINVYAGISEYGREMENQETPKEERERPGIKRARRAKHEVYVPSIMGPATLEVTSYMDSNSREDNPAPSSSRSTQNYQSHAHEKSASAAASSTSNIKEEQDLRKVSTASQPEEAPRQSRGSERNSNKNTERGDIEGGNHTRTSERATNATTVTPVKQVQKGKEADKKGKKRKTKQSKSQDFSPPDDADTIDPDEPTYCLCDQVISQLKCLIINMH